MRLFIAILFSPALRQALLTAQDALRAHAESGNFTHPENLHLTLAFLGETKNVRGAQSAIERCAPCAFPLALGGGGRFGQLYWAGIAANPTLETLAGNLHDALTEEGFSLETRAFTPHVTLARQVRADLPLLLEIPPASMTVERLSLMRSDRVGGKLVYTEIYSRRLAAEE